MTDPSDLSSLHQDIRAESGYAYGAIGADIHVFGDGTPLYLLFTHRPATAHDTEWLRVQPSRMLDARAEIVDFTGRDAELGSLVTWRETGPRFAVRWLHGEGGQGKTRLAAALATNAAHAGWLVVDAVHRMETHPPPTGSQDLHVIGHAGVLLLVDYADRWPVSDLSWLFQNRLLHQPLPTRVLLVARSASGWPAVQAKLHRLREEADTSDQRLLPLPDSGGHRDTMFTVARDCFARRYQEIFSPQDIAPPGPLDQQDFGLTLAVHMAALVAVDARANGCTPPKDMVGLTTYLLNREHENWRQLYENSDTGLDFHTSDAVLARTVFAAILTGPTSRPTAQAVLRMLLPGESVEQVLRDYAVCYPPTDPASANMLEPLLPDRLAEDFLALTLPGSPITSYPTDDWAATSTTALLHRDENGAPPTWVSRAVTFLSSAADRWPHVGRSHLYPVLRTDSQLALDAGSPALTALARIGTTHPAVEQDIITVLESVAAVMPNDRHVDLVVGILAVTERLTDHHLDLADDPATRAALYRNLGIRYGDTGQYDQALAATGNAVTIIRQLAATNPTAYLGSLAASLIHLDVWLSKLGRYKEALSATEEAIAAHRKLADTDTADMSTLAVAIHNRAIELSILGRREEALAAAEEAITIHRMQAEDDAAKLPALALALHNYSVDLSDLGRHDEALSVAEEATAICRTLAKDKPTRYLPELAKVLEYLSERLAAERRREEALSIAHEAVAVYRGLVMSNPDAHLPGLAGALDILGNQLGAIGRWHEALQATEEAVEIRRQLAEGNPAAFLVDLGVTLNNLSLRLSELGQYQEALSASEEAVAIYHRAADANPIAHSPTLALTITNLSVRLSELGRANEALSATLEAVTIYRRLAENNPDAHLPSLAGALHNLGSQWSALERRSDARLAAAESVSIYRRLAAANPAHFADLAAALSNLASFQSPEEALPTAEEAVAIHRSHMNPSLTGDVSHFAAALTNLGNRLSDSGRPEEALTVSEEAVVIYRQLAAASSAHCLGLVSALRNLSNRLSQLGRNIEATRTIEEAVIIHNLLHNRTM